MRVIEKIKETGRSLKDSGIDEAMREAGVLIRHVTGIDAVRIYRDNPLLNRKEVETIDEVLNRRLRHEPLQYITGYVDFLGLKIHVGEGVLIPRPETEFMVEEVIKRFAVHDSQFTILDLCTGSGCLALALAKEFPDSKVYGVDISEVAIRYASRNAELNCINNVIFLEGNLFEPIKKRFTVYGSRFMADLIISNPPYIRSSDIKGLQPEIKDWEPIIALDGGEDGLDFYRRIIPMACHYLKDDGMLVMEICPDGMKQIVDMLKESGYRGIDVIKDYADMERIVMARWKN